MQTDLQIKREFLDQILSGSKVEEYRESSDFNFKKFCDLDSKGNPTAIKPITQIRFFNGYDPARPMAIVEVKEITLDPFEGIDPDQAEQEDTYFCIKLGKVLERQNC